MTRDSVAINDPDRKTQVHRCHEVHVSGYHRQHGGPHRAQMAP